MKALDSNTSLKIGLVLGGGGARGLAHIHVLEVFDELGLKPDVLVGTSIGAIFASAYAAGLSGKDIHEMTLQKVGKRSSILKQLFVQTPKNLFELWNISLSNSLLKPEALLNIVFPDKLNCDFSELDIPLKVVATDFYQKEMAVFDSGSVLTSVAASMAIPGIFQPVTIGEQILIDGGITNPLPFDSIAGDVDISIAIDVTGGPVWDGKNEKKQPSSFNALLASSYILQSTIVKEKLKVTQPSILLKPPVDEFQVLEFYKIKKILEASQSLRDDLKRAIEREFNRANPEKMI